jgi:hypothetical protein
MLVQGVVRCSFFVDRRSRCTPFSFAYLVKIGVRTVLGFKTASLCSGRSPFNMEMAKRWS